MTTLINQTVGSIVFLLLCISIPWAMQCDTAQCPMSQRRHYGFIGGGLSVINPNALNNDLRANGHSAFKKNEGSFILGSHKQMKHVVWESNLILQGSGHNEGDSLRTDAMMADILWNLGFNVMSSVGPMDLFPYVGVGLGGNSLRVQAQTKTFAAALSADEPNMWLWQAKLLINLGIGSDAILKAPKGPMGLIAGIRIGYLFDASRNAKWHTNGATVSDLSELSQSGFYARIVIGGWGDRGHRDSTGTNCMK